MILHITSLPHLSVTKDNSFCAFTARTLSVCRMLTSIGWKCIHYGVEDSDVACEHVTVMSAAERDRLYGVHPREAAISLQFHPDAEIFQLFNSSAAAAILRRRSKGDLFLTIGGTAQAPIAQAIGAMPKLDERTKQPLATDMTAVEFGVGYDGIFTLCRVFDSYSHRAQRAGAMGQSNAMNFFDTVIPNAYDVADVLMGDGGGMTDVLHNYFGVHAGQTGEPYLLFVGRLIKQKGIEIAVATARHCGMKLLIAGQGITRKHPTAIIAGDMAIDEPHVRYIGVLNPEERAKVMGGAHALLAPSQYNEPGGQVVQEAQLCGTPAITTDWGSFPENVEHGQTGFRCNNIREFVAAVKACDSLDRQYIRDRSVRLWSEDRVKWMYDAYLKRVISGVNAHGLNRTDLPADLLALNQSHDWGIDFSDVKFKVQLKDVNSDGNRSLAQT